MPDDNVIVGPWAMSGAPSLPEGAPSFPAHQTPPNSGAPVPSMTAGAPVSPAAAPWVADRPLIDTSGSIEFVVPAEAPPMAPPVQAPAARRAPIPFPGQPNAPRRAMGETPSNGGSGLLGLALLTVGIGVAVGAKMGGLFGAVAGGLYGGATINALRAGLSVVKGSADADREAAVSGTYAVLGAGAATYVLYRTRKERGEAESA